MSKFSPFLMIATLTSSLLIAACSKPETIIMCPYPVPVLGEVKTVVSDEKKIVLNFPSVANNDFYDEEEYYTYAYAFAYAHAVAESHCSEFGKNSKLENESTNEGLTSLSFSCIKH
jgi:hypothetical protein